MRNSKIDNAMYVVLSLGVVFHVYLAVSLTMASVFTFVVIPLFNILPYLMCLILLKYTNKSLMILCAGLSILISDFMLFKNYLFESRPIIYALVGLYAPVGKMIVSIPVGCIIGQMISKFLKTPVDASKPGDY